MTQQPVSRELILRVQEAVADGDSNSDICGRFHISLTTFKRIKRGDILPGERRDGPDPRLPTASHICAIPFCMMPRETVALCAHHVMLLFGKRGDILDDIFAARPAENALARQGSRP